MTAGTKCPQPEPVPLTLTWINTQDPAHGRLTPLMGNIVFKCPRTGMNVQHWLDESAPSDRDGLYETVACKACSRLHFIHRSSGRLLGQPDE